MRKLSKKAGITIFTVAMVILGAIIVLYHNPLADPQDELMKKGIACALIAAAIIAFILLYDKITVLPKELYQNRRLIWKLAKSDFKKRYAGSYMGAFWAMVQPVITVAMYYVVFTILMPQKQGIASGGELDVPFVLFLTAGLVPWFYFSEALTSAMTALLEYNYLVKKVVFKISILPIIKIIAATFIHAFFVIVLLLIACFYGYYPSLYTLQVFYYSACMFILVLAISYTTCSIVIFFRDLQQIVNILLQVGMWATPVLWNINQVIQQSATDTTSPQGNTAAYSVSTMSRNLVTKSFTEHGFIMGLAVVRQDHTYQQGIRRFWSRKDRTDFYWPALANLGEQAILNKEIFAQGTKEDDEVFGYQEAWADYRYAPSYVTGAFRSNLSEDERGGSLDAWHLADYYSELPSLSDTWIEEGDESMNRVLAVSSEVENQFLADMYFVNKTTRPMPIYSVPGLIDHH